MLPAACDSKCTYSPDQGNGPWSLSASRIKRSTRRLFRKCRSGLARDFLQLQHELVLFSILRWQDVFILSFD